MNKARREQLDKLAIAIMDLKEQVEQVLSDEQEYYDNLPENLQSSTRAQTSEEAISNIEEAIGELDTAYECLLSAQG